jgi:hypothetical protein
MRYGGIMMDFNEMHEEKAEGPNSVTLDGDSKITSDKAVQLRNAPSSSFVMEVGIWTDFKEKHPSKTWRGII